MMNRLGSTRTVVTRTYALLAPDGHVGSVLPGWSHCKAVVLASAALGARFSQYLITCESEGRGEGDTGDDSWFFFLVEGAATINGVALSRGGFAYVPPEQHYLVERTKSSAVLLAFRKRYEALGSLAPRPFFTGQEHEVVEVPFLGDPHARLKILIPDDLAADMAVNIFTYDPGATLPFVETHVMEHGILFLAGGGVYRLDADWHPVTTGDAIWIAAYCAQWFIAAGPEPARYIYYKDVNRLP
jgi:(S)-ureidoglycine aminohydrolase